jgi:4a-hydroxytetrahydrobiopterin dehydratase
MLERKRLDDDQIAESLKVVVGWKIEDGQLTKTFEFATYASGVLFAAALAHRADLLDHHPDITIGYRKVRVAVNTHDVGGISHLDFQLAREADGLHAS